MVDATLCVVDETMPPVGRFTQIDWVARTTSTNADLAERARGGDVRGAVRIADEQTGGRGRRDRTWDMPAGGGLLSSFFVPWPDPATCH